MQGQMTRPTEASYIAHAGTPDEMWWDGSDWVKAPAKTTVKLDRVVGAYNAIRDARAARRHLYDKEDALLEEDQQKLKVLMLELLNATGAKSIATEVGTVYRTEKVKASAADWKAVYDWITENPERFELLEKRIKPTFVKQFMEENEGRTPPGVNVHREFEVSVRRANTTPDASPDNQA